MSPTKPHHILIPIVIVLTASGLLFLLQPQAAPEQPACPPHITILQPPSVPTDTFENGLCGDTVTWLAVREGHFDAGWLITGLTSGGVQECWYPDVGDPYCLPETSSWAWNDTVNIHVWASNGTGMLEVRWTFWS